MPIAINPEKQHVIIAGGGLVGLVLAQGLKKRGISYKVYERHENTDGRSQGWAITLHWILDALRQMLPDDLVAKLKGTAVDPFLRDDEGHFLVLSGSDCSTLYHIPPSKERLRANRSKLRSLLLTGLDIEYGKEFVSSEVTEDGVIATFKDGSTATGTILVGADGNHSLVREFLVGKEKAQLNPIPVVTFGVVQTVTPEQAAPFRKLDPLLFQVVHPDTHVFIWYSVQSISEDQQTIELLTMVAHEVKDPSKELPTSATSLEKIKDMKKMTDDFAEPLRSLIRNIPEDDKLKVTTISLADWIPPKWDNHDRVTLAGDATGPMTMYRGEGVNHGMLDAACLVSAISKIETGELTRKEALDMYETEVRERREVAIPLSRQAALDASRGIPPPDSPLIGGRFAPKIASATF